MGKLVLHLPDGSTRDVVLSRERMTIGRRADNDICLPLPTVSAEHAAVITVFDDSFIEDLGSRNGTQVNGKDIRKHLLRDRDEIDIGRQRLVYFASEFEVAQPRHAQGEPSTQADAQATHAPATNAAPESSLQPLPAADLRRVPAPSAIRAEDMVDTAELFGSAPEVETRGATAVDAPLLEVLDGPRAGLVAVLDRDEFVVGRIGLQVAAIRREALGHRLVPLEGETPPSVNGNLVPPEGSLLAAGDEVVVAGTRLRCRIAS